METTAIEKANGTTEIVPITPRGIITAEALTVASEQRALLKQYVEKHMKEDTDYGKIPGTDKPTLLKPGAEKLVDLFRCTPKFVLLYRDEDHERGIYAYTFRVRLYQRDAAAVVAEGFGSANSREGRYRWRNANRKCPMCGHETVFVSKQDPGFYCWVKRGGCGAKFEPADMSITSQVLGRVENDDIATLANTILKMAKKRALVDGAIALARCSDMFTQDAEDMEEPPEVRGGMPPDGPPPAQSAKPASRSKPLAQRATQPGKPYTLVSQGAAAPGPTKPAAEQTVDVPTTAAAPGEPSALEKLLIEAQELATAQGVADAMIEKGTASIWETAAKDEKAARARAHKWIGQLHAAAKRADTEPPPPTDADAPGADSQE